MTWGKSDTKSLCKSRFWTPNVEVSWLVDLNMRASISASCAAATLKRPINLSNTNCCLLQHPAYTKHHWSQTSGYIKTSHEMTLPLQLLNASNSVCLQTEWWKGSWRQVYWSFIAAYCFKTLHWWKSQDRPEVKDQRINLKRAEQPQRADGISAGSDVSQRIIFTVITLFPLLDKYLRTVKHLAPHSWENTTCPQTHNFLLWLLPKKQSHSVLKTQQRQLILHPHSLWPRHSSNTSMTNFD